MVFRESCSPDTPSLISKGGALSAPPWENQPLPKPGIERVNKTINIKDNNNKKNKINNGDNNKNSNNKNNNQLAVTLS